ncbi:MAG: phage tail protein [Lachnospiraceae bacterium]|nr:phage tail protein [Lachnospiraceae bacterium]
MLANGATLGYRKQGTEGEYTNLPGLKEIPEMGVDAEKVANTTLTDPHNMYELGIGDLPDMVYKFKYDNTKAESPYRVLREAQKTGEVLEFQETLKDGSITEFSAQVSVKRTGGGVNGVIDCDVTMIIQSELKYTDPA